MEDKGAGGEQEGTDDKTSEVAVQGAMKPWPEHMMTTCVKLEVKPS